MDWYAWLILVAAVLAPVGLGIALRVSKNRVGLLLSVLSWAGAAACVAVATSALALAILIPAKAPEWLRDAFGLESGEKTAATPWVRWALVVIAIVVIILPRLWGRAIWPDVAVALVLTIGIYATVKQHHHAERPKTTTLAPALTFSLPATKVTTLGNVPEKKKAYVFVVRPKTVSDGKAVTYESHRYNATRVACRAAKNICIAIERGANDANIVSFTATAEAPTRVYLSPRK